MKRMFAELVSFFGGITEQVGIDMQEESAARQRVVRFGGIAVLFCVAMVIAILWAIA